jgi:PelA/Pel-15E family pectate lyase
MTSRFGLLVALALGAVTPLSAAVVGTNSPAQPLTVERIAALPVEQRSAWKQYLERSNRQLRADQNVLLGEMREHGMKESVLPPSGRHARSIPLDKPAEWYGQPEALHIADIAVSFQTPAGGWSKNLDLSRHVRAPGEGFAPDNQSLYLGEVDFDAPHDTHWSYVGTFDNDATIAEMRYLAKVIAAVGRRRGESYCASFLRGLDYIFAAQYPNGGWPQVWPLQGGYHEAITFNDGAMINILSLLREVSASRNQFTFVPGMSRALAAASFRRGVECILAAQIVADGQRTVWCQQYYPLALQPTSARNYEMPSQCASESAGIMTFLMELPNPSPRAVAAVRAAAGWFERTKISDVAYRRDGDAGRRLVPAPGNGPLWARYYEIGTDRPIFGDRDKSIHDAVNEISLERRNGYSWYGDSPKRALEQYARWSKARPPVHAR